MSKAQLARRARPRAADFLDLPKSGDHPTALASHPRQQSDDDDTSDHSDTEQDDDLDVPRVAQWVDEDDIELQSPSDASAGSDPDSDLAEDDSDDDASPPLPRRSSRTLQSLEDDLSTLPLGTLRTAQRSLALAHAHPHDSDADADSSDSDASADAPAPSKAKHGPTKRTHKHAPTEVTSKRPVSRRRTVIDDTHPKPRDPRFMHAAGRFDQSTFARQYDFLRGLRSAERHTLREHLARARKHHLTSPAHLRADRAQEVERLERALKRAESAVNVDTRERAEREALEGVKRAEKEKRKQGKAEWWMKRSEKKVLLAKARLDAVASVGGKRAVKKALEKKQKKIGQKEKRSRPFPQGPKRHPVGSVESERGSKRRKVA